MSEAMTATRAETAIASEPITGRMSEILTPDALRFLAELHTRFEPQRQQRLAARRVRQAEFDAGSLPDFLAETAAIRASDWTVAPIPDDLLDRRVEITGPVDRKMIVNALNSGAKVFMADFEDANSPTFSNCIDGQINLKDRWAGTIDFIDPNTDKAYKLSDTPAVLVIRPRGWRLDERHVTVGGEVMSGALFDFGLYMFHCAKAAISSGSGPYFYLPKMESHLEARLWNEVIAFTQDYLGVPQGTVKATVLIETLPAAFEMDEILYELRQHIVGLNCGRWDYIFSFIKTFSENPHFLTPDRSKMVMGDAFLKAYSLELIKTCHRRGAFAMGGMAAQIPVKNNPEANAAAFARVKADKEREAGNGHDGTWVAHPDLVPIAMEVFDRLMPQPNQLDKLRQDVETGRMDLLKVHDGTRTEAGLRENIRVGIQYIEAWLRGKGAVPLYNLMEDAATAEISRTQVWQWIKHGAALDDGRTVSREMVLGLIDDEMAKLDAASGQFPEAIRLFTELSTAPSCRDFLTVPAYEVLR
jgi:malate synthase